MILTFTDGDEDWFINKMVKEFKQMPEIADEMWFNNLWTGSNSNKSVNVIYPWFPAGVIRYRLRIKIEITRDDKKNGVNV